MNNVNREGKLMELHVDPERMIVGFYEISFMETGIYVKAKDESGRWKSVDISLLDRESLKTWLLGRDKIAINIVGILLGHGRLVEAKPEL